MTLVLILTHTSLLHIDSRHVNLKHKFSVYHKNNMQALTFKISVFHCLRLVPLFRQSNNEERCLKTRGNRIPRYFKGLRAPQEQRHKA